jgi:cytochrome b6-f complex iron-sulfur subunit
VRAGSAARLEVGAARSVVFHGVPVLLICLEPDRYVAISATCTHMQVCKVEWDRDRRHLLCPCHGGAFDIHGNVVRGPASVPLSTYSVERVGDELFVRRS